MDSRRKLDDTTAAMQELGRENQSLQVFHQNMLCANIKLFRLLLLLLLGIKLTDEPIVEGLSQWSFRMDLLVQKFWANTFRSSS